MEMKRVKVATHEELEILQKSVDGILSFVLDVRNIFGYDCFVEETEEEIKIVRKLYDLLVFSMEPDDLNEQLKSQNQKIRKHAHLFTDSSKQN